MEDRFLARGKREDNGKWITGYYAKIPNPADKLNKEFHIIFEFDGQANYVIPETVGSCTSLTDKNNKHIYEGDFLKAGDFIFVVKFGKCGGVNNVDHEVGYIGFYVIPVDKDAELLINNGLRTDILYWLNSNDVYVIGNIHDNKQMLSRADTPVPNDVSQPVLAPATPENFEIFPA